VLVWIAAIWIIIGHILLEQDGSETRVESTNTLGLEDLAESTDQTVGEGGLRDETNTGGLERAEGNVGEELGAGGGCEVDGSAVVGGGLVADHVDGLLLEQLVTSELEGTLEEVTGSGGTETSPDGASALVGDDLLEAADQAIVVRGGVELYPGLDAANYCQLGAPTSCRAHRQNARSEPLAAAAAAGRRENVHIDGCEGAVGDGAADGTGEGKARVQGNARGRCRVDVGGDVGLDGIELGRAGAGRGGGGGHFAGG
jgi:hypothetical protein